MGCPGGGARGGTGQTGAPEAGAQWGGEAEVGRGGAAEISVVGVVVDAVVDVGAAVDEVVVGVGSVGSTVVWDDIDGRVGAGGPLAAVGSQEFQTGENL